MTENFLLSYLGRVEANYSQSLAISLAMSVSFCSEFLGLLSEKAIETGKNQLANKIKNAQDENEEPSIDLERHLGDYGRIDLQIHFDQQLVLGLENKIDALLGDDQIGRYLRYYQTYFPDSFVLIFLAPSNYPHTSSIDFDHPNIIHITYNELAGIAEQLASECADGGFENKFLNALSIYYFQIDRGGNTPYQHTKTAHRSGKKRLYYNWHIRSTWDVLHQVRDEVANELGFVKNSNAMFMGAALEEMSQKPINTFVDMENLYAEVWDGFRKGGRQLSEERYYYAIADHIMQRINDQDFKLRVQNLAIQLKDKPYTEGIKSQIRKNPAKADEFSTEMVPTDIEVK